MNDQQIYTLMAKTPDIRAVQIADALDAELADVSEALRSLVAVGDVVRHAGTGPNGRPAQLYNLSETFKKSRDGQALLAKVTAMPASTTTTEPDPEQASVPAQPATTTFPTPVFTDQEELRKPPTKAEMVTNHLEAHKSATDDELRVVMGIPKTSHPRAYLKFQLTSGTLVRDESGRWTLGDGTPPPKPERPVKPPEPDLNETKKDTPMASTTPPAAQTAAPTETVFRCGLWSDGVLELQRNGTQVAALTQREGEQLVDFMGRMLGQAEKVAA